MAKVPMASPGTRESGSLILDSRMGTSAGSGGPAPAQPTGSPTFWAQMAAAPPAVVPPGYVPPTQPGPYLSPIPQYNDPLAGFNPAAVGAGNMDWLSQMGGSFQPGSIDTSVDAGWENLVRDRMAGGGIPGLEEVMTGVYDPWAATAEREAARDMDSAVEMMISRGILDSSEAGRHIADIAVELNENKLAKMGEIGWQYEQLKQDSINNAIAQFGIMEGNKLSAKVTITAANISAASQVQSAAIGAGATVQAAGISAQARLQEAGLNASVALETLRRQMDMDLVEQGVDPVLFQNDPEYRGGIIEGFLNQRQQEQWLIDYIMTQHESDLIGKASGA